MKPVFLICSAAVGLAACASPSHAAEWRLNPNLCPDLIEDRLDRAENRRDRRDAYGGLRRVVVIRP